MEQEQNTNPRKDYMLPASILVAGIMVSASIIYLVGSKGGGGARVGQEGDSGRQLAAVGAVAGGPKEVGGRDVVLGDPKAPVTLIEYGDFQCPFCARFHSQVGVQLREEYIKTGKVKMVFRNFQFLGPESIAAAGAAECAKDQGKFWVFHDAIYDEEIRDGRKNNNSENNGNLNREFFVSTAQSLGLNSGDFAACIDGEKYADQVAQDTSAAQAIDVNSTPTTFVNGRLIRGAVPYEQFKQVIEEELKKRG